MQPSLVDDAVFDTECYHRFYDPGMTAERSDAEVRFVAERIGAPPRRVLDLACGHGRHANRLAGLGYAVTGIDASPAFLAEAAADARARGVAVDYRRGDMRALDAVSAFDAAVCLFTAFGYFVDEENLAVLRAVARALAPGGLLLIDTMNRDRALRAWKDTAISEREGDFMLDRIRYDAVSGRSINDRSYLVRGRRVDARFSVRLYTLPELGALLAQAGLRLEAAWGGFDGQPYALDAPRLIVAARKPASGP